MSLLKYTLCINMVFIWNPLLNKVNFKYNISLQVALKVYIVHKMVLIYNLLLNMITFKI